MIKATVKVAFFDLQENVYRNAGDVFLTDQKRAEYLNRLNWISYKEAPEQEKPTRGRKKKSEV